jgi:hypothetical protein
MSRGGDPISVQYRTLTINVFPTKKVTERRHDSDHHRALPGS